VLRDGVPALASILPLSITFDHRVITGVEACAFLVALTADLERQH
jgi:pyruvate/2-oxoglutarate dehydrogenase complex dihydrolipoamide acyltransferase (E2) component